MTPGPTTATDLTGSGPPTGFTPHHSRWGGRVYLTCGTCRGRSPDALPRPDGQEPALLAAFRDHHDLLHGTAHR